MSFFKLGIVAPSDSLDHSSTLLCMVWCSSSDSVPQATSIALACSLA